MAATAIPMPCHRMEATEIVDPGEPEQGTPPKGDDQRVDEMVRRYSGPLRSFFLKRAFDRQEAEDLVQEVFCRLAARSDASAVEHPEAYMFQAAANLLRDRARRDLSRAAAIRELEALSKDSFEELCPERVLLGKRRVAELNRALAELPERTRTIFVLHRFEEFKYAEIAVRLNISSSSVEKHMMDAIRHIKLRIGSK